MRIMVEPLAVEVIGVSKRYGERDALTSVHLAVKPGQLHGLLGPNGAGKTTLLRILLGLVAADAGTVRLLGSDIRSTRGPIPAGVAGFVETAAFYPYLSALRNLTLLARLDGSADSRAAVEIALEQVALSAHANDTVGGFSAGMRQRLSLAAALIRTPRVLLLDEPTSSLDPVAAREVRAVDRRLAENGTAVLLSSHDLAEVEELCASITVIQGGRVVFGGDVDALRARASALIYALRTNDDRATLAIAGVHPGVKIARSPDVGFELSGDLAAIDAFVVALGKEGAAIRGSDARTRSLESLFLELTGHHPHAPESAVLGLAAR
jgi:ABC-2 type transport system ATP-binding protein